MCLRKLLSCETRQSAVFVDAQSIVIPCARSPICLIEANKRLFQSLQQTMLLVSTAWLVFASQLYLKMLLHV